MSSTNTLRWQRLLAVIVITVMVIASFSFASNTAKAQPAPTYKTLTGTAQKPVGFAVSQPLSTLAEQVRQPQVEVGTSTDDPLDLPVQEFIGGNQIPRQSVVGDQATRDFDRPMIDPDKKLFDDPSPALDWQWAGLSQGVNRAWYSYGVYPPDTQGDISSDHYIQVVNVQMEIWTLNAVTAYTGTPLPLYVGPIDTLWVGSGLTACEQSEDGDPVVVYDEYDDRWILSQFALPNYGTPGGPHYECIAVSATSDPMGSWYLYQYAFPVMNDYPKFGVWHDAYYMSINQFEPASSPSWRGQGAVAFDKAAMQVGNPAAGMIYINAGAACMLGTEPECVLGGMIPADSDGSTLPTGPEVFMQFDDDAWGYSPDQLQLWKFIPNWTTGTGTFAHLMNIPTAPFDSEVCANYARNCIPQLNTAQGLDAIADRLMYRLQYRNFGTHASMVVNHTVDVSGAYPVGQAGIRWYELRNDGIGWYIYQQNDFAPDTANRWMGSAAMDAVGNIALGYSISDATMYPGVRYTVHLVSDPLNTMRTEKVMVTGGGAQTGTGARWGDYSMMSVIPDSPWGGCDMVYTQEYLRGTTAAEWSTWLGWFHNDSCYYGDTTSPDTTISGTGTAGPNSTTAEFTFSGDDGGGAGVGVTYECSLDGATFATCTSSKNYTGLAIGDHSFQVRAVDTSENIDQTPAIYNWTVNLVTTITETYYSIGQFDGWVLESGENTGVGGTLDKTATTFALGDNAADRQYRSFLHFNTSLLPDNAVVTKVTLKIRRQGLAGTDPFTILGGLNVDMVKPFFGTAYGLELADFQALAGENTVATFDIVPVTNWYSALLNGAGQAYINLTGVTQFRLGFATDDNDNAIADYMRFYSGDYGTLSVRPTLIIEYYIP